MKRERPTQRRIDELEAEVDELREALRQLLFLKQMRDDCVTGEWPGYVHADRLAWKEARDLVSGEG